MFVPTVRYNKLRILGRIITHRGGIRLNYRTQRVTVDIQPLEVQQTLFATQPAAETDTIEVYHFHTAAVSGEQYIAARIVAVQYTAPVQRCRESAYSLQYICSVRIAGLPDQFVEGVLALRFAAGVPTLAQHAQHARLAVRNRRWCQAIHPQRILVTAACLTPAKQSVPQPAQQVRHSKLLDYNIIRQPQRIAPAEDNLALVPAVKLADLLNRTEAVQPL